MSDESRTKAAKRPRGRPSAAAEPVASREEFLDAALGAFADLGYDGASTRELARRLNVSHNLINARFGSKESLWKEAVDHGMQRLVEQLEKAGQGSSPDASVEERLRDVYVSFMLGLDKAPAVLRLMNREGQYASERLQYIYKSYIRIGTFQGDIVLAEGQAAGDFRSVSRAILFFLVAHGGGSIFSLGALSELLEAPVDDTTASKRACAEAVADILINGIKA